MRNRCVVAVPSLRYAPTQSRFGRGNSILRDAGAIDIDKRVDEWRASAGRGFDPKAQPYSFDDRTRPVALRHTGEVAGTRPAGLRR